MILYDPTCIKKIKSFIDNESFTYIIPGIIGKLDMELSYVCYLLVYLFIYLLV